MSKWTLNLPETFPATLHATAISAHGQALVICGPSGAGKTSLAFQMLALGADLISDDLVTLEALDTGIIARHPNPANILHGIEARGFAVLRAEPSPGAQLGALIDLSKTSVRRVPKVQTRKLGDCDIPIFNKVDTPAFPAILMHYLRYGPYDDSF